MIFLYLLLGAVIGVVLFEEQGLIPGLLLGLAGYQIYVLRKKVQQLTGQVDALQNSLSDLIEQGEGRVKAHAEAASQDITAPETSVSMKPSEDDSGGSLFERLGSKMTFSSEPVFAGGSEERSSSEIDEATHKIERREVGQILDALLGFFRGGNWLVRSGIVVLFIGLSFLVRLAIEYRLFPLEVRLVAAGLVGAAMVVIGWRLVSRRPEYGLTLEGGGVAVMYLTVFASYRLYDLLSEPVAALLLVLITAFGVSIALRQDAQWLAVVCMIGGFLVPVLVSTKDGSHVALFSYYAILNGGILCIAWFKGWRFLNFTGFVCTFGVGTAWGGLYYDAEFFSTTEPFLVLFFLMYLSIALLYAEKHSYSARKVVDGTLVFGLPVAVISLQAALVDSYEYGMAVSSLLMGLCYIGLSLVIRRRAGDTLDNIIEAFDGIGIALLSMTIPFSVNATWTGIGWALEGAALVWLGIRQQRNLVRIGGYMLLLIASLSFVYGYQLEAREGIGPYLPILNPLFTGYFTISLSMLFVAFQLERKKSHIYNIEHVIGAIAVIGGVGFWLAGGFTEIDREMTSPHRSLTQLTFVGISTLALSLFGRRHDWSALVRTTLYNIPLLYLFALGASIFGHPFEAWGAVAWLVAIAGGYVSLYALENRIKHGLLGFAHALYMWLIVILASIESVHAIDRITDPDSVWNVVSILIPMVAIAYFATRLSREDFWPFNTHLMAYLKTATIPLLSILAVMSLHVSFNNAGDPEPLIYLPLLNPLDLGLAMAAVVGCLWFFRVDEVSDIFSGSGRQVMVWTLAALVFVWLNATIARTIHHWGAVPYTSEMFESSVFQTTLSVCWTIMAVTAMVFSVQRGVRGTWMAAAALLAVVVIKLFIIDLSNLTTVHRIVSFIAVGVLLLVIGYVAPAPPRSKNDATRRS